ncbi:hypothetical protein [Rhizobium rhizoryzae]|uniref:hypothetical protein n=1 Tax=Rhizobium rhizoryzae TaxID=451876 RepID=UPI002899819D|nr:hypothetical protein [Rhizobium rhizoryzae]
MIDSDRRRVIFDQVRDKAIARGTPIDDDPEFLGWVELWISGEYGISEFRSRYNDLVARRAQRSKSGTDVGEPDRRDSEQNDIPDPDSNPQTTVRDAS